MSEERPAEKKVRSASRTSIGRAATISRLEMIAHAMTAHVMTARAMIARAMIEDLARKDPEASIATGARAAAAAAAAAARDDRADAGNRVDLTNLRRKGNDTNQLSLPFFLEVLVERSDRVDHVCGSRHSALS
jgi:ribosomal protein L12E/L44/L45/RPP1/RPP2